MVEKTKADNFVPHKFDESYIGRKNNMLTVIGIVWDIKTHKRRFACQCECGKLYYVKPTFWENGKVKSCGCLWESKKVEHTKELDRLRSIRQGMIDRCYNPSSDAWDYYGGRGIYICKEWLDSFDVFAEWALSHGYSNELTIDRIDTNGNYEPNNCRWADYKTQRANQRPRYSGKMVRFCGEKMSINELCEKYDLDRRTLIHNLNQGEPIMRAVLRAEQKKRRMNGKTN